MPPKNKKQKKTKKEPPPPPMEVVEEPSKDSLLDREIDLVTDLNEDFFNSYNKRVQSLMQNNRASEAAYMTKFGTILRNLHKRYIAELKENEELKPQVERANIQLRIALELTGNSQEAMDRLKGILGDAWKESDASQLREQDIQTKLQELLVKCESFEAKDSRQQDDTAEFGHLAKHKAIILRERDRINGEVMDLEKRLQLQRYYAETLEYVNKNAEEANSKLNKSVKVLSSEKNNLEIKCRALTLNLDEQKEFNLKTLNKLDAVTKELQDVQHKFSQKSSDYDRQRIVLDKMRNENLSYSRQLAKNSDELAANQLQRREMEDTIKALRSEDKIKADTINQLTKKYKKSIQDHNMLSSKLYKMDRLNNSLGEDIVKKNNQMNALEKDLITSAFKFEDLRRLKDYVTRERDGLRSDIAKMNNQMSDLRHTIMMQSNNIDNLNLDIQKLNVKLDEAKINIAKAERERDEMAQEVESLHERIEYLNEQIQLKTDQVIDLTENLKLKHASLINVKKQLEHVHSEKMVLQRSLETCTQERDNFRVLQTKSAHQMAQLSAEINANQNKISLLNLKIERLNTEKKELQTELRNTEAILVNVRSDLKEMKVKNDRLLKTIADDELRFMKLSHNLDDTRKEKNLIGLQMVRRNDEIVLLKEQLHIVQTALDQGQAQYNQRIEDIRLLKVEITNLQTERDCLSRAIKSTADMREEIIRLQRSLNQERVKCRALTEDARTPATVHRWRVLKGSDPNKYQLLQKVQFLQRRNLKQEIDKTNLEQKLKETEKVCDSLKKIVDNLPTSDVKLRLAESQRILREREKKLKALVAELSVSEIEVQARDCIIEEFKTTLKLTKESMCQDGKQEIERAELMALEFSRDEKKEI